MGFTPGRGWKRVKRRRRAIVTASPLGVFPYLASSHWLLGANMLMTGWNAGLLSSHLPSCVWDMHFYHCYGNRLLSGVQGHPVSWKPREMSIATAQAGMSATHGTYNLVFKTIDLSPCCCAHYFRLCLIGLVSCSSMNVWTLHKWIIIKPHGHWA